MAPVLGIPDDGVWGGKRAWMQTLLMLLYILFIYVNVEKLHIVALKGQVVIFI